MTEQETELLLKAGAAAGLDVGVIHRRPHRRAPQARSPAERSGAKVERLVRQRFSENDMNEWRQEWQPTERDNRLHDLATRYHTECEAYDRTVCTGPMGQDGIMPANQHEMALINRNAHAVRKRLTEEAEREGIGREELVRAISKWHSSLPNAKLSGCPAERTE